VSAEARTTLEQTLALNATIDELLALAREGRAKQRTTFDLARLTREHVVDWQARYTAVGRSLDLDLTPCEVSGTPGLAGQVIDLMLANSLEHSRDTTHVQVRDGAVEVWDGGPGIPAHKLAHLFAPSDPAAPHGRGLPLARRLAEADGGTFDLVDPRRARFRYSLRADPSPVT
jgi:signal transduction histidine kinase